MADAHKHSSESMEHHTPPEIVEPCRTLLGSFDLDPASCALANRVVQAKQFYTREDNGFLRSWWGNVFLNPPGGICDKDGRRVIRASKKQKREACTVTGACGLPPGHKHEGEKSSALAWWSKLVHEWKCGDVESAIFVGFNFEIAQTTARWARDNRELGWPCSIATAGFTVWLAERVPYLKPGVDDHGEEAHEVGENPPGGSFLVYLPRHGSILLPPFRERITKLFAELGDVTTAVRP